MTLRTVIYVLLLATPLSLSAQSTTPQTPPSGSQAQTGSGSAQSTMPPGHMHGGMQGMQGDMQAMHEQHMQQMKGQVAKMRSLLEQMKASVAGMSGKDKAAMDANVQLWQMMVDHMDQMVQHMSSMGMADMGTRNDGIAKNSQSTTADHGVVSRPVLQGSLEDVPNK